MASMAIGIVTVLLSPEPVRVALQPKNAGEWLQSVLIEPLRIIRPYRWQAADPCR
jgi:PAT family beta-lactamase induction signal transducer AmpG